MSLAFYASQAIGKGAYGVVCSAKNAQNGEKVAIKKIGNAFENLTDARRTLREIKLLRHLRHENIIGVRDIMKASRDRFNDVYLVYELMDTDLHQIIRSSQPLTNEHFQYFIYQVAKRAHSITQAAQQRHTTTLPACPRGVQGLVSVAVVNWLAGSAGASRVFWPTFVMMRRLGTKCNCHARASLRIWVCSPFPNPAARAHGAY